MDYFEMFLRKRKLTKNKMISFRMKFDKRF